MSGKLNKGRGKRSTLRLVPPSNDNEWAQSGYVRVVGKDHRPVVTAVHSTESVLHVREISPGVIARLLPEERELIRRRFIERDGAPASPPASKVTDLQARALDRLNTIIAQDGSIQVA